MKYLLLLIPFLLVSCGSITQSELEKPMDPNVEAMAFKSIDRLLEAQPTIKKLMTFTNSSVKKKELVITMSKNPKKEIMINISTAGDTLLATISNNPTHNKIRFIPEKYLNFLKNYILTDFILVHAPADFINQEVKGFRVTELTNERKIQRNGQDFSDIIFLDKKTIKVNNVANKYELMINEI